MDRFLCVYLPESREGEPVPQALEYAFAPTLSALLELPARRVLVTHGAPVLDDGAAALRAAVATEPWYHHG